MDSLVGYALSEVKGFAGQSDSNHSFSSSGVVVDLYGFGTEREVRFNH